MKLIIIVIISLVVTNPVYPQSPSIEWQRALGGTDEDKAHSVSVLVDGSIVIAGGAVSNNGNVSGNHMAWGGAYDFWVIKLDSNGNLLWQKCFGGNGEDEANSIKETIDGGFIIAGSAGSYDGDVTGLHTNGLPHSDYWVVKIDSLGNLQWQKCYGGTQVDIAYDIEQTIDSGYIIVGEAGSQDGDVTVNHFNAGYDAWVVKIDGIGNIQWQKSLGGSIDDTGYSIKQTSDGGYAVGVLAGSVDGDINCNHYYSDYWLVKLDSAGNILWTKCFGGSQPDALFSMDITWDHGFILCGESSSTDGDVTGLIGATDIWIVKTDSIGTLLWQKCYGGSSYERGFGIKTTSDSGAVIAGLSYSGDSSAFCNHSFYSDLWALQIDKLGNLEWTKCMGGMMEDEGADIVETNNHGYVIAGYTKSNDGDVSGNHGGTCVSDSCPDYWVVKLSPLGTAIQEQNSISDFYLHFYNSTQTMAMSTIAGENTKVEMQLFDVTGRKILNQAFELQAGLNKKEIQTGDLNAGIYLVRLATDTGAVVKKLMVE